MNKFKTELKKYSTEYYSNKLKLLKDIFGTEDVITDNQNVIVNGHPYPVIDDVIIILDPNQYPPSVKKSLNPLLNSSGVVDTLTFT